jgi:hypothetical protein
MRLLPIFLLIFSCVAYGQELNNPNKLRLCPTDQSQRFHNCWGTQFFVNGDKYVGGFKDGKRHGQGTFFFAAGSKYVGEFKDGKKHGQGTLTFTSGNRYVGEWRDDQKHGQGVFIVANGDEYVGDFKSDKRHGRGILTKANGRRLEGIWENDSFISGVNQNVPNPNSRDVATNTDRADIDRERQQLADERLRLQEEKQQQEQQAAIERERQRQHIAEERRRIEEEKRQQAENKKDNNSKKQTIFSDSRRRLALVIGNAAYKNSPLRNPINDADLISNALSGSGFIVSRYDNLTYAKMREVVRAFGEKLNRGDVGLFYFSGHAVQYRGKNYLLPINEDLKHSDEIPSSALDVDFVLAKMETAKNDLNIVILDSCRNNPLGSETRNLDRGLTTISAAKGTFIAFATSPGNVALDGSGSNSPYTKNLAQAIRKGGLTLEQVFKETRRNVISETNSQQVPWENSSILGDFYFR